MTYMLVRNRVADFAKWKAVFDSHSEAHKEAGFRLVTAVNRFYLRKPAFANRTG